MDSGVKTYRNIEFNPLHRNSGSSKPKMEFKYDPSGNRIEKIVRRSSLPIDWIFSYYFRDAQGNIMATYHGTYEDSVVIPTSDYSWLFDSLQNKVGTDSLAAFMDTYYTTGAGLDALHDYLVDHGDLSSVVRHFGQSYYEGVSGYKLDALEQVPDADIINNVTEYDRGLIWFVYSSDMTGFLNYALTSYCNTLLGSLSTTDLNAIATAIPYLSPPATASYICSNAHAPLDIVTAMMSSVPAGNINMAVNSLPWADYANICLSYYPGTALTIITNNPDDVYSFLKHMLPVYFPPLMAMFQMRPCTTCW